MQILNLTAKNEIEFVRSIHAATRYELARYGRLLLLLLSLSHHHRSVVTTGRRPTNGCDTFRKSHEKGTLELDALALLNYAIYDRLIGFEIIHIVNWYDARLSSPLAVAVVVNEELMAMMMMMICTKQKAYVRIRIQNNFIHSFGNCRICLHIRSTGGWLTDWLASCWYCARVYAK